MLIWKFLARRPSIVLAKEGRGASHAAANIDQHSRSRQADLAIEHKLGTHDWSKRVNLSIFGMIVVDAMLVYKISTLSEETPNVFFHKLAEEMIDYQLTTKQQREAVIETAKAVHGVAGNGAGLDLL
jgi:hypothetical protein